MIEGLLFIFLFQLIGTALTAMFSIPIPGPVIGMALLLVWLALRFKTPEYLDQLCDVFLRYLPLLFVPAAVGVINYKDTINAAGLPIVVILIVSTVAALIAASISFIVVAKRLCPPMGDEKRKGEEQANATNI